MRPISARLDGVRVGHWTDAGAATGCTVLVMPAGTVASGEVRGGAPGTREWELLLPGRSVDRVDAVFLSGGSAFGLAVGDGVSRWCEERGIGYPTPGGPVPIVVGAVLYDLDVGDGGRRPGPAEGYAACVAAQGWPPAAAGGSGEGAARLGRVGAGAGAMVGRRRGPAGRRPGGMGWAVRSVGDVVVSALVAVNSMGDVIPLQRDGVFAWGAAGSWVAGAGEAGERGCAGGAGGSLVATTLGVVVTNARLEKLSCHLVAQSAHDGLARALDPVHTSADGDAVVAAATGDVDADLSDVRQLAATAIEAAVRAAAG